MPLQWTAKGILIRWQDKTNYRIGLLAEDGTVEALRQGRWLYNGCLYNKGWKSYNL